MSETALMAIQAALFFVAMLIAYFFVGDAINRLPRKPNSISA